MKKFEQLTIKRVKKEIIAWETEMGREPKSVEVIYIGQNPDEELYEQDDGTFCEQFYAHVVIDGEEMTRYYEWNCTDEEISASSDEDSHENDCDNNNDEQLPPNIVERCKYVGQSLATLDLSEAQVDVKKELAVPVVRIRMDYPFPVESGDFNVYSIPEAKTWGELLTEIIKVFQREYNAGKNAAPHALEDFVIEPIDIHPNNLATVMIGS